MPFVFLAAVAVAGAYLVRVRRGESATASAGVSTSAAIGSGSVAKPRLVGIRGWLLVYMIGLAAEVAHGLALTVGAIVISANPSLAGFHSFIPLWALLIYVASNLGLLAYGAVLFVLMTRERKAAVAHNILFNALSIAFLVVWFVLSAKSPIGTVIDGLPGLAAIAYFLRSRRVRNTFTY